MKKIIYLAAIIFGFSSCSTEKSEQETALPVENLLTLADPFIGTDYHGHTYPGATVPFGMVQLSPDNGFSGWDWCSGYHYSDSILVGFSHTHLSGTGIGDLADILLMPAPATTNIDLSQPVANPRTSPWAARYRHQDEEAHPGYYRVTTENGIQIELTASERSGMQRYTFPEPGKQQVILDLGYAVNWDRPVETSLEKIDNNTLRGYRYSTGWAKDQRIYFNIAFDQPIQSISIADSTAILNQRTSQGKKLRALVVFDNPEQELLVKTGISSASRPGAELNLKSELPGWDFEAVKQDAENRWAEALNQIEVSGGPEKDLRTFYTALYHTKMAPVLFSDLNGEYKGADGEVHQAEGYNRYTIFSLWDTFRAAHPLFTLVESPDFIRDLVLSMMSHYKQYGYLPVWELHGNETNTMTGYHAIPVLADAIMKDYEGFDQREVYEAMKRSGMQDIRNVDLYKKYNYIPSGMAEESVTKTLEYAYDDWCLAEVAAKLGLEQDEQYFRQRAANFRQVFDQESGFMRGRLADGSWRTPFDPKFSSHMVNTDYTEGNAWQHTWFVPQDVAGLIELMGGPEAFSAKLDRLFTEASEITGENASMDISGLIGQYAHGNEPSHHIAYMYNYAGQPWKTQAIVRKIMQEMYHDRPDGLCGNEDCGQMSAWYVLSALGLYPVNPAEGVYVIGSPLFRQAKVNLWNGKVFEVKAYGNSEANVYVQSAKLNGVALDRSYLTHQEILAGGRLELQMGAEPKQNLWTEPTAYPKSMSDQ